MGTLAPGVNIHVFHEEITYKAYEGTTTGSLGYKICIPYKETLLHETRHTTSYLNPHGNRTLSISGDLNVEYIDKVVFTKRNEMGFLGAEKSLIPSSLRLNSLLAFTEALRVLDIPLETNAMREISVALTSIQRSPPEHLDKAVGDNLVAILFNASETFKDSLYAGSIRSRIVNIYSIYFPLTELLNDAIRHNQDEQVKLYLLNAEMQQLGELLLSIDQDLPVPLIVKFARPSKKKMPQEFATPSNISHSFEQFQSLNPTITPNLFLTLGSYLLQSVKTVGMEFEVLNRIWSFIAADQMQGRQHIASTSTADATAALTKTELFPDLIPDLNQVSVNGLLRMTLYFRYWDVFTRITNESPIPDSVVSSFFQAISQILDKQVSTGYTYSRSTRTGYHNYYNYPNYSSTLHYEPAPEAQRMKEHLKKFFSSVKDIRPENHSLVPNSLGYLLELLNKTALKKQDNTQTSLQLLSLVRDVTQLSQKIILQALSCDVSDENNVFTPELLLNTCIKLTGLSPVLQAKSSDAVAAGIEHMNDIDVIKVSWALVATTAEYPSIMNAIFPRVLRALTISHPPAHASTTPLDTKDSLEAVPTDIDQLNTQRAFNVLNSFLQGFDVWNETIHTKKKAPRATFQVPTPLQKEVTTLMKIALKPYDIKVPFTFSFEWVPILRLISLGITGCKKANKSKEFLGYFLSSIENMKATRQALAIFEASESEQRRFDLLYQIYSLVYSEKTYGKCLTAINEQLEFHRQWFTQMNELKNASSLFQELFFIRPEIENELSAIEAALSNMRTPVLRLMTTPDSNPEKIAPHTLNMVRHFGQTWRSELFSNLFPYVNHEIEKLVISPTEVSKPPDSSEPEPVGEVRLEVKHPKTSSKQYIYVFGHKFSIGRDVFNLIRMRGELLLENITKELEDQQKIGGEGTDDVPHSPKQPSPKSKTGMFGKKYLPGGKKRVSEVSSSRFIKAIQTTVLLISTILKKARWIFCSSNLIVRHLLFFPKLKPEEIDQEVSLIFDGAEGPEIGQFKKILYVWTHREHYVLISQSLLSTYKGWMIKNADDSIKKSIDDSISILRIANAEHILNDDEELVISLDTGSSVLQSPDEAFAEMSVSVKNKHILSLGIPAEEFLDSCLKIETTFEIINKIPKEIHGFIFELLIAISKSEELCALFRDNSSVPIDTILAALHQSSGDYLVTKSVISTLDKMRGEIDSIYNGVLIDCPFSDIKSFLQRVVNWLKNSFQRYKEELPRGKAKRRANLLTFSKNFLPQTTTDLNTLRLATDSLRALIESAGKRGSATIMTASYCIQGIFSFRIDKEGHGVLNVFHESELGEKKLNEEAIRNARAQAMLTIGSVEDALQETSRAPKDSSREGSEQDDEERENMIIQMKFLEACSVSDRILDLLESLVALGHPLFIPNSESIRARIDELFTIRERLIIQQQEYTDALYNLRVKCHELSVFTGSDIRTLCFGSEQNAMAVLKLLGETIPEEEFSKVLIQVRQTASAFQNQAPKILEQFPRIFKPLLEISVFDSRSQSTDLPCESASFKGTVVIPVERSKTFASIFAVFRASDGSPFPNISNLLFASPVTTADELHAFIFKASGSPDILHVIAFADLLPYSLRSEHMETLLSTRKESIQLALLVSTGNEDYFPYRRHQLAERDISIMPPPPRTKLFFSSTAGNGKTYQISKGKPFMVRAHLSGVFSPRTFIEKISDSLESAAHLGFLHLEIGRTVDMMQANPDETNTDKRLDQKTFDENDLYAGTSTLTLLCGLFSILHFGCIRGDGHVFWIPVENSEIYIEAMTTMKNYLTKMLVKSLGFNEESTILCSFNWDDFSFVDKNNSQDYRLCASALASIKNSHEGEVIPWDAAFADSFPDSVIIDYLKEMYTLDLSQYFVKTVNPELLTFRLIIETVKLFSHLLNLFTINEFYAHSMLQVMLEGQTLTPEKIRLTVLEALLAEARASSVGSIEQVAQAQRHGSSNSKVIGWNDMKRFMVVFNSKYPSGPIMYWHPNPDDLQGTMSFRFPEPLLTLYRSQCGENWNPENFDMLSTEIFRQKLFEAFCLPSDKPLYDLDPSFCLTADNTFKMLLIYQRLQCGLPVILQGEAGVGKTRLIRFLSGLLDRNPSMSCNEFVSLTMNEGTPFDLLMEVIYRANSLSDETDQVILFLDEVNASPYLDEITHLLIEGFIRGVRLKPNIKLVAAMNPRRTIDEKVHKQGTKSQVIGLTSKLVYRVYEAPFKLMQTAIDFGALHPNDEKSYIESICSFAPELIAHRIAPQFKEIFAEVIVTCHRFLHSSTSDAPWTCSLRDARRAVRFFAFFVDRKDLFQTTSKKLHRFGTSSSGVNAPHLRALILSIYITYIVRLPKQKSREMLIAQIATILDRNSFVLGGGWKNHKSAFETTTYNARMAILKRLQPPPGIAFNLALGENALVLIAGICTRTPAIIVGPPGTSKSLALSLVLSFLGSANNKWRSISKLPRVLSLSYQGSEAATSEGVLTVANRVNELVSARDRDTGKVVSLFVFDELGLAQSAPANPLKVLHDLLEPTGCYKRLLDTSSKNEASEVPPYAFVGLSNHVLDAAPTSRSVVLFRPIPDVKELANTLEELYLVQMKIRSTQEAKDIAVKTAEAHMKTQKLAEKSGYKGWVGTRDIYSLIRMISAKRAQYTTNLEMNDLAIAVSRCYGGMGVQITKEVISIFRGALISQSVPFRVPSPIELFDDNILDRSSNARHLCIIGDPVIVPALANRLSSDDRPVLILRGSSYEDDRHNGDFAHQILCSLINAANNGFIVFLVGLRSILGACFDLLNRCYLRSSGNYGVCRIALGAASDHLCQVSDDLRVIITMTSEDAAEEEEALLQRLEKVSLSTSDLLMNNSLLSASLGVFSDAVKFIKIDQLPFFSSRHLVSDVLAHAYHLSNENYVEEAIRILAKLTPLSRAIDFFREHGDMMGTMSPHALKTETPHSIASRIIMHCLDGLGAFPELSKFIISSVEAARKMNQSASGLSLVLSGFYSLSNKREMLLRIMKGVKVKKMKTIGIGAADSTKDLRRLFMDTFEEFKTHRESILLITVQGDHSIHLDTAIHVLSEIRSAFERSKSRVHAFFIVSNPAEGVSASPLSGWDCAIIDSIDVPAQISNSLMAMKTDDIEAKEIPFIRQLLHLRPEMSITPDLLESMLIPSFYTLRLPSTKLFQILLRQLHALQKELEEKDSEIAKTIIYALNVELANIMTKTTSWTEEVAKSLSVESSFLDELTTDVLRICQYSYIKILVPLVETGILYYPSSKNFPQFPPELDELSHSLWCSIVSSSSGKFSEIKQQISERTNSLRGSSEHQMIGPGTVNVIVEQKDNYQIPYNIFVQAAIANTQARLQEARQAISMITDEQDITNAINVFQEELRALVDSPLLEEFLNKLFEIEDGKFGSLLYIPLLNNLMGFFHAPPELWFLTNTNRVPLTPSISSQTPTFSQSRGFEDLDKRVEMSSSRIATTQVTEPLKDHSYPPSLAHLVTRFFSNDSISNSLFEARIRAYNILLPIVGEARALHACSATIEELSVSIIREMVSVFDCSASSVLVPRSTGKRRPSSLPVHEEWIIWTESAKELANIQTMLFPSEFIAERESAFSLSSIAFALLEYCTDSLTYIEFPISLLHNAIGIAILLDSVESFQENISPELLVPSHEGPNQITAEDHSHLSQVIPSFYRKILNYISPFVFTQVFSRLSPALATAIVSEFVEKIIGSMLNICEGSAEKFLTQLFSKRTDCYKFFKGAVFDTFDAMVAQQLRNSMETKSIVPLLSALYSFIAKNVLMRFRNEKEDRFREFLSQISEKHRKLLVPEISFLSPRILSAAFDILSLDHHLLLPAQFCFSSIIASIAILSTIGATVSVKLLKNIPMNPIEERLANELANAPHNTFFFGPVVSIFRNGMLFDSLEVIERSVELYGEQTKNTALQMFSVTVTLEEMKNGFAEYSSPMMLDSVIKLQDEIMGSRSTLPPSTLLRAASLMKLPVEFDCDASSSDLLKLARFLAIGEVFKTKFPTVGELHCIAQIWGAAAEQQQSSSSYWLSSLLFSNFNNIHNPKTFIPTMWPLRMLRDTVGAAVGDSITNKHFTNSKSFDSRVMLWRCSCGNIIGVANCGFNPSKSEFSDLKNASDQMFGCKKCPRCKKELSSQSMSQLGRPNITQFRSAVKPHAEGGIIPEIPDVFESECHTLWTNVMRNGLENNFTATQGGMLLHFITNITLLGRFLLAGLVRSRAKEIQTVKDLVGPDPRVYFLEQAAASFNAIKRSFGNSESATKRISEVLTSIFQHPKLRVPLPKSYEEKTLLDTSLVDVMNNISGSLEITDDSGEDKTAQSTLLIKAFYQKPISPETLTAPALLSSVISEVKEPVSFRVLRDTLGVDTSVAELHPATHLFLSTPNELAVSLAALPYIMRMAALGRKICSTLTSQQALETSIASVMSPNSVIAQSIGMSFEKLVSTIIKGHHAWELAVPETLPFECTTIPTRFSFEASVAFLCPNTRDQGIAMLLGLTMLIERHNDFYSELPEQFKTRAHLGRKKMKLMKKNLEIRELGFFDEKIQIQEQGVAPDETGEPSKAEEIVEQPKEAFKLLPLDGFFVHPHSHHVTNNALLESLPHITFMPHTQSMSLLPIPASNTISLPAFEVSVHCLFVGRRPIRPLSKREQIAPFIDELQRIAPTQNVLEQLYELIEQTPLSETLRARLAPHVTPINAATIRYELHILAFAAQYVGKLASISTLGALIKASSLSEMCRLALSVRAIERAHPKYLVGIYSLAEEQISAAEVCAQLPYEYNIDLASAAEAAIADVFQSLDEQKKLSRLIRRFVFRQFYAGNPDRPLCEWIDVVMDDYFDDPTVQTCSIPDMVLFANTGSLIAWLERSIVAAEQQAQQTERQRDAEKSLLTANTRT
eukprot:gnl/Chilomastix_cuspidata/3253.p1 GENE.gnl/Chilomastix_cuspidata/3253~~gnl/Chilomastix_cuspidata/3253.p1  ORF type:complete len:4904 (+),score=307.51 gnl/Chilomastix_cuspidata/3253:362-15073(+)